MLAAGYELRRILSCGWLEFWRRDMSCGWFYPTTDSSSCGWIWLALDLYLQILSKIKNLFCKTHHFYGLFSSGWFQLPLIYVPNAASRCMKKLQALTNSSSSGWFKLRQLIRDLRPIDHLQNFGPNALW